MIHLFKRLLVVCMCTALSISFSTDTARTPADNVPESIMESVIIVNGSSGVVVYSDTTSSLVLTCFHVISSSIFSETPIFVGYLHLNSVTGELTMTPFEVVGLDIDMAKDLAVLEINTDSVLPHSDIALLEEYPSLGDSIFLGSNPNMKYRSLKKGIISSKERFNGQEFLWEVSGGIIFGSSGGGAFNSDGRLFGVIKAVDALKIKCWDIKDDSGNIKEDCLYIPVYENGFVVPPDVVRNFIIDGLYSEYFTYLR